MLQDLSREEQLLIWMRRNGLTYSKVAKMLGISRMSVQRLCTADRIPTSRSRQLKKLGIPEELLPEARDVPRGRPYKL
ncbi:MAG: helix-turn-helix domain-containing protein [Desulfovibrionaceae bacterium]|nr:helix-turn-helix domain-containing protein [Desulfovibrionaceae bacterium]